MGYRKAEEILPMEIIELIQRYVDGESIYIPRKENQRKEWGDKTFIRQELEDRNFQIFTDFQNGYKVQELSIKYFLSEKSIQRILRKMK
jgi:Mor family transcriptional regulator